MKNEKVLGKIWNNLDRLIDDYADLPETKEAESRFWEYVKENIFRVGIQLKELDLENALYDVAFFNEKQGFLYGFNYALALMGNYDVMTDSEFSTGHSELLPDVSKDFENE